MWVDYPKLKEGDEGTFLLKQDSLSGTPMALAAGKEVKAYLVESYKNVRSKADSANIKRLLKVH